MIYRTASSPSEPRVVVSLAARTDADPSRPVADMFLVTDVTRRAALGPEPLREAWTSPFQLVAGVYHAFSPWDEGGDDWHLASRLCATTVHALLCADPPLESAGALDRRLEAALDAAAKALFDEAQQTAGFLGAAAEAVTAAISGGELMVAHVGCARAYLLRDGRLSQITRDHSMIHGAIDEGQVPPEAVAWLVATVPHVRAQVLGPKESVDVGRFAVDLRRGDRLLLCSHMDGPRPLSTADLGATLLAHPDPDDACRAVIAAARDRGEALAVTVIVAAFDGDDLPMPAAGDEIEDQNRLRLPPGER
jgi:protein phosphatase